MLIELIVFRGNNGELQVRGDFLVRYDHSFFDKQFADYLVVVGINIGDHIRTIILQALDFGQIVFIAQKDAKTGSHDSKGNDEEEKEYPEPDWQAILPPFRWELVLRSHNQWRIIAQTYRIQDAALLTGAALL